LPESAAVVCWVALDVVAAVVAAVVAVVAFVVVAAGVQAALTNSIEIAKKPVRIVLMDLFIFFPPNICFHV
jgi:hypothetical protein